MIRVIQARFAAEMAARAAERGGRLQAQAYNVAFLILIGRKPTIVSPTPQAAKRFRNAVARTIRQIRKARAR